MARSRAGRTLFAALVSLLMVATAGASVYAIISSGVFSEDVDLLDGSLSSGGVRVEAALSGSEDIEIAATYRLTQPRDPFKPLISEAPPVEPPVEPVDGEPPPTTVPVDGFEPSGIRVVLVEIREVSGVKRATVTVDGTSYDVGVGDTFATNFKVVSLSDQSGVFMFGDNVFELSVGQEILK